MRPINSKKDFPRISEDKSHDIKQIFIPADGDCLYTSIFVGYLLPAINNENDFKLRLRSLIGYARCLDAEPYALKKCIEDGMNNINWLKHPNFKEYITFFKRHMGLGDKTWGGT